jgi:hypothetical protein
MLPDEVKLLNLYRTLPDWLNGLSDRQRMMIINWLSGKRKEPPAVVKKKYGEYTSYLPFMLMFAAVAGKL